MTSISHLSIILPCRRSCILSRSRTFARPRVSRLQLGATRFTPCRRRLGAALGLFFYIGVSNVRRVRPPPCCQQRQIHGQV